MRPPIVMAVIGLALLAAGCTGLGPKPTPAPTPAPTVAATPPEPPPPDPESAVTGPGPAKAHCVPRTFPKAPKYPDTDPALRDAGGAADRYQLLAAGRILRMRRLAELEKLLEGCRQ